MTYEAPWSEFCIYEEPWLDFVAMESMLDGAVRATMYGR
jgi:nicotinic acid phosphoribosyltransferase